MFAKLTVFAVALVLVTATVALAGNALDEKNSPDEIVLSQAALPIYVSTGVFSSAFSDKSHELTLEP